MLQWCALVVVGLLQHVSRQCVLITLQGRLSNSGASLPSKSVRYPPKRDRLYTVGPEPKGRLAGREHIADVAVGVWEEDEGVD
jgi:hypothetical protein